MPPRPKTARSSHQPPPFIAPQLTALVRAPPGGEGWGHEIKLDGYRLHARIADGKVQLLTRTGLDWSGRYAAIAAALRELPVTSAYLDGEVCAFRADGTTSFSDLQAATDALRSAGLTYVAFDLLFLDGEDWRARPLAERKARLEA